MEGENDKVVFKITGKERGMPFLLKQSFTKRSTATARTKFLRQMDDDLPFKSRDKSLKTLKVIKITPFKRRTRRER